MSKNNKSDELLNKFNDSVIHSSNDARDEIDVLEQTIKELEKE